MKRNTVSVAMLGVAEEQSRALVAATKVIASRLPADLHWEADATRAEIVICNTGDGPGKDLGARLPADNDAVLVPYTEAGACPEHGIGRPLRMAHLQEALAAALKRVLEQPPPSEEQIARRRYRGQSLEGGAAPEKPKAGAYARVYRGRAV